MVHLILKLHFSISAHNLSSLRMGVLRKPRDICLFFVFIDLYVVLLTFCATLIDLEDCIFSMNIISIHCIILGNRVKLGDSNNHYFRTQLSSEQNLSLISSNNSLKHFCLSKPIFLPFKNANRTRLPFLIFNGNKCLHYVKMPLKKLPKTHLSHTGIELLRKHVLKKLFF